MWKFHPHDAQPPALGNFRPLGPYKDNMYTTIIDDTTFCVKPMNCPGGVLVYKSTPHSYRDLPVRMGELGLVHRHENPALCMGLCA